MHRSNQRGAALPFAILMIALLSIGAVAGVHRIASERRVAANLEGEADAFALAAAGLSRYAAFATAAPAASIDTVITGLPGGSATVSVRLLRAAAGLVPALYVIRSYGVHATTTRFDHRTPSAERSVAQFAIWRPGSMEVTAAWTSVTGIEKNGGSGTISGIDQCGAAPSVAGVAVPTTAEDLGPGYDQNGGASVPTGSPPIAYPGINPTTFAATVEIDWNAIVNGGVITPHYSLTGTSSWPSSLTNWPIVFVTAANLSLNPTHSGRGLLIVTGNLTLGGGFSWDGVILVGGRLISNGNHALQGAVVTGLNVQLGMTVPTSDLGNGNKTIHYNSCHVTSALQSLGSLVTFGNARLDNWPSY